MKRMKIIVGGALVLGLAACTASEAELGAQSEGRALELASRDDDDDDDDEYEVDISVDSIPAIVRSAAEAAAPGIVIQEAEREGRADFVYCVHGTVDGVFTEVEVSAAGEVLDIERGDEEEEDDD